MFLYLINVNPGWQALPLSTSATPQVLGLLNVFMATGIAVNTAFIIYHPPWFKAMGEYVIGSFGLAVLLRTWIVFPFELNGFGETATVPARSTLILAMTATVVALTARLVAVRRMLEA